MVLMPKDATADLWAVAFVRRARRWSAAGIPLSDVDAARRQSPWLGGHPHPVSGNCRVKRLKHGAAPCIRAEQSAGTGKRLRPCSMGVSRAPFSALHKRVVLFYCSRILSAEPRPKRHMIILPTSPLRRHPAVPFSTFPYHRTAVLLSSGGVRRLSRPYPQPLHRC